MTSIATRQLGRDGPRVPVLGLGAWPFGGGMGRVEERDSIRTIHAAIDAGVTLVDTAQAYRSSEATVGKALKGGYRERCFLATKASFDYSRGGIREAMENSLRALEVEYVDLYQVHSYNPDIPLAETMGAMAELQAEGKTRFIGVSNFDAGQMRDALGVAPFHSNQPRYNLLDRDIEAEDLPFCEREGVGVLAHSPLAKGLLTGKYRPGHRFPDDDERSRLPRFQSESFDATIGIVDALAELAGDKGISPVQLAVAWLLRLPAVTCVLVGAKSPEQVAEHVKAAGVTFSGSELARVEEILGAG